LGNIPEELSGSRFTVKSSSVQVSDARTSVLPDDNNSDGTNRVFECPFSRPSAILHDGNLVTPARYSASPKLIGKSAFSCAANLLTIRNYLLFPRMPWGNRFDRVCKHRVRRVVTQGIARNTPTACCNYQKRIRGPSARKNFA